MCKLPFLKKKSGVVPFLPTMTSRADMAWNLPIMLMWCSAFLQNNTHQIITSERQQLVPLLNYDYWDVQILLTTICVPYVFRKSIFGWNCDHDTPLCDTPLLEDTPLCDTPDELVPLLNYDYWDVQILLTNGFSAASKVSFPVNGDHYCLSFFGKV